MPTIGASTVCKGPVKLAGVTIQHDKTCAGCGVDKQHKCHGETAFPVQSDDSAPGVRDAHFVNVHEVVTNVEAPCDRDTVFACEESEQTAFTKVVPDCNHVSCPDGDNAKERVICRDTAE